MAKSQRVKRTKVVLTARPAVVPDGTRPEFKRERDYFVYWRSGLKSRVHGHMLVLALAFYLTRARFIRDAETGEQVWEA